MADDINPWTSHHSQVLHIQSVSSLIAHTLMLNPCTPYGCSICNKDISRSAKAGKVY